MEDSLEKIRDSVLKLMDYADQDYKHYAGSIRLLKERIELQKTIWLKEAIDFFMDPEGHLLGGFFVEWSKAPLRHTWYIEDNKKIIKEGFDLIINSK